MNNHLHVSEAGLDFIRGFEGLYLTAYYDSVGVITIGYGHTNLDGYAPKVVPGLKITEEQAEQILRRSIQDRYEVSVKKYVTVPLTQGQFDALVSFCFNCGEGNLKRLVRFLNTGDYGSVARLLPQYNRAGGKVLRGLTRRRLGEVALWNKADTKSIIEKHVEEQQPDTVILPADPKEAPQIPTSMPQQVDTPDELPDKIAKWGGALSMFSSVFGYLTDWRVAAIIVAGAVVGGIVYAVWRYKTKP